MKLAIYTCATKNYAYAVRCQAKRVQAMVSACARRFTLKVIIVGDGCETNKLAAQDYEALLPGAEVVLIEKEEFKEDSENYSNNAQLLISQMRTIATSEARAWGADYCLSLDSDVLPPSNALRCMLDMLSFDDDYYSIAACPYPSQGGGSFLCGRGTPARPILPCFYDDEKEIPQSLLDRRDGLMEKIRARKEKGPTKKMEADLKEIEKKIEQMPPKANVFSLNGERWRRRGWFDNAYPAIGKGSVVPSDWCGFGCTLINKEALALCDWSGYLGYGTEDLYIVWKKWYPAGLRIAAIPHAPCDHVIRDRKTPGKYIHLITGHETEGECVGHLRQEAVPWIEQIAGNTYDKDDHNDKRLST